ncbi:MAG: MMPL family transporter [Fibrobacterales bacterium]
MSILICRLLHSVHKRPLTVLTISLIVSLFALYQASHLQLNLRLLDLFPDDQPATIAAKKLQENFGGFGTLDVIVQSKSPEANHRIITSLEKKLHDTTLINFVEYKTEASFFLKHRLLYISLEDLELVRDRVTTLVHDIRKTRHPFVVQLSDPTSESIDSLMQDSTLQFADIENKYSHSLKERLGTHDQTIQLLKIYPDFDVTDIKKSLVLYNRVKKQLSTIDTAGVSIHYAGEIYSNILSEGKLISELKRSAWIPIAIILAFLLFYFYRQPMIPLLTVIPIGIGVLWTLGVFALSRKNLDMTSLLLAIVIVGLGVDSVVYLLSRYGEERRKGLGPEIAFENIILETGPAVTTSSLTTAASFFCIALIPFPAFHTIGIYGGAGIICIWLSVMLNFPCILILIQRFHVFKVYGKKIYNHIQFRRRPFTLWKLPIPFLIVIFLFLGFYGFYPQFEYDFDKLGFVNENRYAESLLKKAKEEYTEPAIFIANNDVETTQLVEHLHGLKNNPNSTIRKIISYHSLLPLNQEEKLEIIDELKEILTPKIQSQLTSELITTTKKLTDYWDVPPLHQEDLPESIKRKFMGRNQKLSKFIFVFPKDQTNDGLAARRFRNEISAITLGSSTLYATGKAILTADFLDLTLPHLGRVLFWSLLAIGLILYIDSRSIKNTLILLIPVLIGGLIFIGVLNFLGLKFNSISIIIFPLFLGLASDATIHLFFRYQEEQSGSLFFVLMRTGTTVAIAIFTSVIGFIGLLFASHGGLYSLGIMIFIAFFITLLVAFVIFPMVMGFYDTSRWNKRLKRLKLKDEIESPNPPTFY